MNRNTNKPTGKHIVIRKKAVEAENREIPKHETMSQTRTLMNYLNQETSSSGQKRDADSDIFLFKVAEKCVCEEKVKRLPVRNVLRAAVASKLRSTARTDAEGGNNHAVVRRNLHFHRSTPACHIAEASQPASVDTGRQAGRQAFTNSLPPNNFHVYLDPPSLTPPTGTVT